MTKSILAHLKHQLRKAVPYHGIKLMLVGNEAKGKTSLSAQLRGVPPPPQNNATVGVEIHEWDLRSRLRVGRSEAYPNINFSIWDFAGQKDFTVTHKVFLSSHGLYLLLFDVRIQREGVMSLRSWLLDIQAHAEKSNVIIVGTHVDFLSDRSCLEDLRKTIRSELECKGYPKIKDVFFVSCSPQSPEGIEELKMGIYKVACNIELNSQEKLIGRMVPKSYLDLQRLIREEAKRRRDEDDWMVLSRRIPQTHALQSKQ